MTNPFTYGGPITDPKRFTGRRREVDQVLTRLTNAEGESTAVVGERRIGKTSLLKHLASPAVHQPYGIGPSDHTFVYIDLQVLDQTATPERLWQRLLRVTAGRCRSSPVAEALVAPAGQPLDTLVLTEVFDTVVRHGHRVVLLLDEFDSVTRNPHFGPDFFFGLRSLAINYPLSLVTSSQRDLIDLCHSPEVGASPFFNIFATVRLRPLSEGEANGLVATALAGGDVAFDDADHELVWDISGGHPFFLQMACHMLYRCHCEGLDASARRAAVQQHFKHEAMGHFATYWHASDDAERIVLTAIALLARRRGAGRPTFGVDDLTAIYTRAEPALATLERRGLVIGGRAEYELFSSAMVEWTLSEISATLDEHQSYEEWLDTRQHQMAHLVAPIRSELSQILPRVRARYREMIVAWASNPNNLAAVARLLQATLDGAHGQW